MRSCNRSQLYRARNNTTEVAFSKIYVLDTLAMLMPYKLIGQEAHEWQHVLEEDAEGSASIGAIR